MMEEHGASYATENRAHEDFKRSNNGNISKQHATEMSKARDEIAAEDEKQKEVVPNYK